MHTRHIWCLALVLAISPLRAAQPRGRIVEDIWQEARLEGFKAGYVHTRVREVEESGDKRLHTTSELHLVLLRNQRRIGLRMETGSEETSTGRVVAVSMRQFQGEQEQIHMRGTVVDDQLSIRVAGSTHLEMKIPWNERVIGLYRQQHLFKERQVRPGDVFSFLTFEPVITTVVTNQVTVKDYEEVTGPAGKRRLLRVESTPDPVKANEAQVQLPGMTTWLDEDLLPVQSSFVIPQLGTVVLYRSAQPVSLPTKPPDVDFLRTALIPIRTAIHNPSQVRSAVYRITVKGDTDPTSAFVQDERQSCRNVQNDTFELHVRSSVPPQPAQVPQTGQQPNEEFLNSCYWIDSDAAAIRRDAKLAVKKETDPWKKARLIEHWVHETMQVAFDEPFAPASEVAKTRRGDCRQHALLTTALCRAAGVPARTAIGLCYADDRKQGPVMAFHMWTEVWVQGQWLAIDATRGFGSVGATHLKITDHSWHNIQSLTPLLPLYRVLGKLSIEVVSYQ
jgi:transglutaminase-like putative cysteine protease